MQPYWGATDASITAYHPYRSDWTEGTISFDRNNLTGEINQTFPDDININLKLIGNPLVSLNVSGSTSLTTLICRENQLTSVNVSGCTSLKTLSCTNNKILSEIPDWFSQLEVFTHDVRYRYYKKNITGPILHEDKGIGWWYPGEPEKGEHSPN